MKTSSTRGRPHENSNGKVLLLSEAIEEIIRVCKDENIAYLNGVTERYSSPFFFIVGAGISAPQVPTAGEVIKLCQAESPGKGRAGGHQPKPLDQEWIDYYSDALEKAYPSPIQRQRFFRDLIESSGFRSLTCGLATSF